MVRKASKGEAKMLNLTPHAITIERENGERVTYPPQGVVARVETLEQDSGRMAAGVPVVIRRFGQITGLPPGDEACLVSSLVLEAVYKGHPWRRNVFAPDTGASAIRDGEGRIVAVRRLIGVSAFPNDEKEAIKCVK
jgi:hypothetical protein